jgi:predicted HAD superfamily Cof-like phosphohydrolase
MGPREIDLVKWGFTQGGLTLVLILTLVSYRRDFFRRNEAKEVELEHERGEKRMFAAVIEKNAQAMTQHALSVQANTEATRMLAQNVNNLADRRHEHRQ